jgi:hypothetical protein
LECTPVIVEVYYETLNPQSRKFFLEELRPTFEHIRESITIDLIPFGRTKMNITGPNETTFECPNGEQQCLGNKIQVSFNMKTNSISKSIQSLFYSHNTFSI